MISQRDRAYARTHVGFRAERQYKLLPKLEACNACINAIQVTP